MIADKRILAVIAARGGSKGIPRKNVRLLAGRPLIAWSIVSARASVLIDELAVSSDDDEILQVASEWGCQTIVRRPASLATDQSGVEDALIHTMDTLQNGDFDYLVLLQPTSPLRITADIDSTIRACHESGAPAGLTICEPGKSPFWMCTRGEDGRLQPLIESPKLANRRQDLPPAFALNGAVYVARIPWFRRHRTFYTAETIGYLMPAERSFDLDTELDWKIVSALVESDIRQAPVAPTGLETKQ